MNTCVALFTCLSSWYFCSKNCTIWSLALFKITRLLQQGFGSLLPILSLYAAQNWVGEKISRSYWFFNYVSASADSVTTTRASKSVQTPGFNIRNTCTDYVNLVFLVHGSSVDVISIISGKNIILHYIHACKHQTVSCKTCRLQRS